MAAADHRRGAASGRSRASSASQPNSTAPALALFAALATRGARSRWKSSTGLLADRLEKRLTKPGRLEEVLCSLLTRGGQAERRAAHAAAEAKLNGFIGAPKGIRTPVFAVKGRRPRPLDDGREASPTASTKRGDL